MYPNGDVLHQMYRCCILHFKYTSKIPPIYTGVAYGTIVAAVVMSQVLGGPIAAGMMFGVCVFCEGMCGVRVCVWCEGMCIVSGYVFCSTLLHLFLLHLLIIIPCITPVLLSMDGMLGIAGWRWLFIMEGVPTVLFGVYMYYTLADAPDSDGLLSLEEQGWLLQRWVGGWGWGVGCM